MYMGAGPELHGYTEWGSQTPELPSRVVNKHGIFPTVFSLLRESDPKAEIGCICEWAGIRYVVDTLALSYDKNITEKPQNPATAKCAVEYIKRARPALVVILEFSTPRNPLFRRVYGLYSHRLLPAIGGMISKDRKAYEYLPASVDEFPAPECFMAMMREAGFKDCRARSQSLGIAQIYTGEK